MVAELMHDYAHEAHEIKEAHHHVDSSLPRGKKVNPLMHALGKTTSAIIKGLPQLMLFGVAAGLITGFGVPAFQAMFSAAEVAVPSIASVFGFTETGFSLGAMNSSLLALPAVGAAIKGIIEFPKAMKEANQHNDRVDGKLPARSQARGQGRGLTAEEGMIATVGAMDQAPQQEQAWHPAQEQRGSFVERVRPDGPVTGAERIAAMVEAERAARSEQSL